MLLDVDVVLVILDKVTAVDVVLAMKMNLRFLLNLSIVDTTADDLFEGGIEEGDEPQTPDCEVHSEEVSTNAPSS